MNTSPEQTQRSYQQSRSILIQQYETHIWTDHEGTHKGIVDLECKRCNKFRRDIDRNVLAESKIIRQEIP